MKCTLQDYLIKNRDNMSKGLSKTLYAIDRQFPNKKDTYVTDKDNKTIYVNTKREVYKSKFDDSVGTLIKMQREINRYGVIVNEKSESQLIHRITEQADDNERHQ